MAGSPRVTAQWQGNALRCTQSQAYLRLLSLPKPRHVMATFGSCHRSKPGVEVSCSQTASHILVPSALGSGHNEEKSEVHMTVTYKQRESMRKATMKKLTLQESELITSELCALQEMPTSCNCYLSVRKSSKPPQSNQFCWSVIKARQNIPGFVL